MIALIAGTGIYDPAIFNTIEKRIVKTPYGRPSDTITIAKFGDKEIAFLPRHGAKHTISPHKVNYRANIWALKRIGVKRIISLNAVGSLRQNIKPGQILIPDQFIDMTKGRITTFYEKGKVVHISVADPFCPQLRRLAIKTVKKLKLSFHQSGTYICIEGPRFSTKAESRLWQKMGADVVGMTIVPEAQLAREVELCYLPICTITDYDVWAKKPVNIKDVIKRIEKTKTQLQTILTKLIPIIPEQRCCICNQALKDAVI
jgi:5'-methylthioadenosine phosphorylase